MTLDGRIADCRGGSKWITSEAARREVQEIRRRHSAIVIGKGTLACDDPKLTARCGKRTYYPARIVFSPDDNIPQGSYFCKHCDETRSIVVVRDSGVGAPPRGRGRAVSNCEECGELTRSAINRTSPASGGNGEGGIELWRAKSANDAECINAFLDMAYDQGLSGVLVEGGQRLASAFLENGFVNKLYLFYGNKMFGAGYDGLVFSKGLSVNESIVLNNVTHRSFGDNFLVTGYVK